ncbi:hypothetical protein ABTJ90_19840, partial [Acinetobacter baumannii]
EALSKALGVPVVTTVAVKSGGADALLELLEDVRPGTALPAAEAGDVADDHRRVRDILASLELDTVQAHAFSDRADRVLLHPLVGPL